MQASAEGHSDGRERRLLVLGFLLAACTAPASPLLNQLQNSSFEEDWLVSDGLAKHRWGLIARAEAGYGEADGKIDHWEVPAAWRDSSVAHSGMYSVKLTGGKKLTQAVRVAMRSAPGGNPANGNETDGKPIAPGDHARVEKRVVAGGAWIKAAGLPEGKAKIAISGAGKAEVAIPGGTYDWKWVEVSSPDPWAAEAQMAISVECVEGAGGTIWVDDAALGEVSLGKNLAVNGDFEKLDSNGWPDGYSQPEPFWWFRYDYYSWTGWGHDGGYGCQIPQRIGLVPGYRWRGHAAVDPLVFHSGRFSMRMVAFPGDNFGVLGPVIDLDGGKPFELAAWVKADNIHQVELMAVNAENNEYVLLDSENFNDLEAAGVTSGSKGQGSYDWTYLRKLVCPRSPLKKIRPMLAVRGFDGRIIEKNIVGTVWFDDLAVIPRGGTDPTAPAATPSADPVRVTDFALGDRRWGKNLATVTLQGEKDASVDVRLTIASPKGERQEIVQHAESKAGRPAIVPLAYRIDTLCTAWDEQYAVELAVTTGGKTRVLRTAFGTPSSLLSTRVSHQYLFPEEKLVVAANVQVSRQSLEELSQVCLQIVDAQGKTVAQTAVDNPAERLPVMVPESRVFQYLNVDRCVTLAPDLGACKIRPWREASRDYTITVRLIGKDGQEKGRAEGMQFGRITHFDPSELKFTEKAKIPHYTIWQPEGTVSVNSEHFLLVNGKPFFPVYFGEYGDTFRQEEGVNINRDQIASLGVNPLTLTDEQRAKYGMGKNWGEGEWDLNGMTNIKLEAITAAFDKMRADNPGRLVAGGYDLISHPASRRADLAQYFFPAYDVAGAEVSFASYVPNLRADYFPAMKGKNCAIFVGYENYYFVSYDVLRYRSYLTVMRGAAGLGLIPSRMMEGRPECNNYLRGLNAECRALAPVFAAPPAKNPTRASLPNLFTWEKELAGKRYLFAVRGEPFLTRGLFHWGDRKSPGGKPAHTEPADPLLAQHWVENTRVVAVAPGDRIVQDVFVEGGAPRMLALQFRERRSVDHTWEHRAYWGSANLKRFVEEATYPADQKPPAPWRAWQVVENPAQPINSAAERGAWYFEVLGGAACKAADGQPSLRRMGDVPPSGAWVTLQVPAREVGLEGQSLDGIAFAVDGGRAFWGKTSLVKADGTEDVLVDGSLNDLAPGSDEWKVRFTVPGTKELKVRALFENVSLGIAGPTFEDRFSEPYRARVYEIEAR